MNYCNLHNRHYDTDECPDCEAQVLTALCGYTAMQQAMIDNHEALCEKCKAIRNPAFHIPSGIAKTLIGYHDETLPELQETEEG